LIGEIVIFILGSNRDSFSCAMVSKLRIFYFVWWYFYYF